MRALLSKLRADSERVQPVQENAPVLSSSPDSVFVYARNALPPMHRFDEISVVPVTADNGMVLTGGPIWPEWPAAGPYRHNRSGVPVDRRPPDPQGPVAEFDGEATWGGYAVGHFGHFMVEHGTRVLQAATEHPDLPMLFALQPGAGPNDVPRFFWQVLDWYGATKENVRWVTRPYRVRGLWAGPMAEQWAHVPTSEAYLDLLDANAARQALPVTGGEIVYVARDRMEATGEGHNAGEPYLCALLEQLGVTVIRPETLPLRDQLAHYASAKVLIFAEGSAMHGRQLLGRADQTALVLNRRPSKRVGLAALHPRVTSLGYAEVTRGTASVLWPNGNPWIVRAISIYQAERLLEAFDSVGVPLRSVWDQTAYEAARDAGIRKWISTRFHEKQPIDHAASLRRVSQEFKALGLEHLLKDLPAGGAA
ncbi:glycosyltransferase 61 family protein [Shimia sp. SDUM112013]|uniref:glycosyltransferase 61 family protein n=1 Tax=Shimia sp. SDUM112013 TaxID=3136160 RepID=UPI0032EF753E